MPDISVVISAFNEEEKIEDCLKSVRELASEIIFVDNTSKDDTVKIAKKYTTKIFLRPNDPVMLNRNKNYGIKKASGAWILSIDADERLSSQLIEEIKEKIMTENFDGYEIPRKNIIFNKWIQNSIWWPDYNLRLFKKGKGFFPEKHVHEKLEINGKVGKLENPIIHFNYQTISQFIKKMDQSYTESEVENFIKSGKSLHWFDAIKYPSGDFLKTFFAQKGYRDGMHGLVLSILQAFYAFIVFAKIWERKDNFKEIAPEPFLKNFFSEVSKLAKEYRYWIYTAKIDENSSKKTLYKILRKIH